jgi:hypothetical protein
VTVWNNFGSTINVFAIDQYGGWRWSESIGKGDTKTFASPPGQVWNVADKKGRVLKQFRAQPGRMTVAVEKDSGEAELNVRRSGDSWRPGFGRPDYGWDRERDRPKLEIRNRTDDPVMAYEVSRWRSWEFRATIRPDGKFETRTERGARWMVTSHRGRPIKEFEVGGDDKKVDIKD